MPIKVGSSPVTATSTARSTVAAPKPAATATTPATGFSGTSTFQDAAGQVLSNVVTNLINGDGSDFASKPRPPNGEGKFEGKSAQDIANMGWDEIKSATPREIYALNHSQLAGVDSVMGDFDHDLSKDQRRAYLRAKIDAGIFQDVMSLMSKYNKIAD